MVAPRSPAMCGSETLAMLVSSTSMNVASITVAAIQAGLALGRQAGRAAGSVSVRAATWRYFTLRAGVVPSVGDGERGRFAWRGSHRHHHLLRSWREAAR